MRLNWQKIRAEGVRKSSQGFTVLELMISTVVFSMVLLVITAGIISFTRQYYKGVVSSKTQATSRAIMSEITQSLQFGRTVTVLPKTSGIEGFCVDNKLFSYVTGRQVEASPSGGSQGYHGMIVDSNGGTCGPGSKSKLSVPNSSAPLPATSRELLADHMRVGYLSVEDKGAGLYAVKLRVIYGDNDLLSSSDWKTALCKSESGSQFCSVSELTTTVQKRL